MKAQAIVEFALILPLLLLILLGGAQLGLLIVADMRLEHAVMEGTIAGAQEPAVPQRCNVAEATTTQILGRVPAQIQCSQPGNLVTLRVSDDIVMILPFIAPTWRLDVEESSVVRR